MAEVFLNRAVGYGPSPHLTKPLRTEAEARIERVARKIMAKYPASTWFAKNERSEKDIRFLAYATHSELEREIEPLLCEACQSHDTEPGDSLCADCRSDQEGQETFERERDAEERAEYRGPRYWRAL